LIEVLNHKSSPEDLLTAFYAVKVCSGEVFQHHLPPQLS